MKKKKKVKMKKKNNPIFNKLMIMLKIKLIKIFKINYIFKMKYLNICMKNISKNNSCILFQLNF